MSYDPYLYPEVMPAQPEKENLEGKNKFFGLWFFLGGETVLFASLFGTYLALKDSTAGVPSSDEIFGLGLVFFMTMLLLTSSLSSVYAIYHMRNNDFKKMILWLGITGLLGIGFISAKEYEFDHFITKYGFPFHFSAFASHFFTIFSFHV